MLLTRSNTATDLTTGLKKHQNGNWTELTINLGFIPKIIGIAVKPSSFESPELMFYK